MKAVHHILVSSAVTRRALEFCYCQPAPPHRVADVLAFVLYPSSRTGGLLPSHHTSLHRLVVPVHLKVWGMREIVLLRRRHRKGELHSISVINMYKRTCTHINVYLNDLSNTLTDAVYQQRVIAGIRNLVSSMHNNHASIVGAVWIAICVAVDVERRGTRKFRHTL